MKLFAILSVAVFLGTAASVLAGEGKPGAIPGSVGDGYDRLDGHGDSGKKVNVIEWAGNLEVHVYPAGSLKGLALKLDTKNKNKPVMVIGLRFDNAPDKQLIRRAILGVEFREGFRAYVDPSARADGYDKIIISNNRQAELAELKLEAEPTQLYPDGHPALAKQEERPAERVPASKQKQPDSVARAAAAPVSTQEEEGQIKPYSW